MSCTCSGLLHGLLPLLTPIHSSLHFLSVISQLLLTSKRTVKKWTSTEGGLSPTVDRDMFLNQMYSVMVSGEELKVYTFVCFDLSLSFILLAYFL